MIIIKWVAFMNDRKIISIEEMKELQLKMMDELHSYCMKNRLSYFLTGGTLIGAVRHNGYIPWDDDIDIVMPRFDYEKMIKNYNLNINSPYKIYSLENNKDYYFPFAKLVDTRTALKENTDSESSMGIYIDIFPLDNMGDNIKDAEKLFRSIGILRKQLAIKTISINTKRSWYKNTILLIGKFFLRRKTLRDISNRINQKSRKYERKELSKYICPVVIATYGLKEILESSCYSDSIFLEFEGNQYCAPVGYDTILRYLYGNYMELPPKNKQVSHHSFKAWWKE